MKITISTYREYSTGRREELTREIEAEETACPQLVIHQSYEWKGDDGGEVVETGKWVITHVPSGLGIIQNIRYKSRAVKACKVLAEIKGWDTINPGNGAEVAAFAEGNRAKLDAARNICYYGKPD
jgi:hypothetical protein